MSSVAGVCFPDKRPLAYSDWMKLAPDEQHSNTTVWSGAGVILTHAQRLAPSGTVIDAQPYVRDEAAILLDGRPLDNRGELQLLLGNQVAPGASDAALALAVFLRFGPDGLDRIIGDWSLVILDRLRNRVVLASDFAGTRPLYYHAGDRCIVWSTRLQPLLEHIQPLRLDEEYMAGFLAFGGYPDLTPYSAVKSVRPGYYVVWSRGRVEIGRFWRPPTHGVIRYQREADYEVHLRELFRDAVHTRMRTGVTVISELSGGLDSSSIVSMAKHLAREHHAAAMSFRTLSYEREGSRDKQFYEWVEKWSGFPAIHLPATCDLYLSEADPGDTLPTFWSGLHACIAAEAKKTGAGTLLTGGLGDLIMGHFEDDTGQIAGLIYDRQIRQALSESLAWGEVLRMPAGRILWRALLMLMPAWFIGARPDLFSEPGATVRSPEDLIAPAFRARMDIGAGREVSVLWTEARPERRKHFRGLLEILELRHLQPPERLAHLYYTHPYAHRPLVEYMLSLPVGLVCRPGERRRLMRRAFRTFWAPALDGRRSKDSFAGVFLQAVRSLAPALIANVNRLQLVQRGYVDPARLKARLDALSHSLDGTEGQLNNVVLLELWLQRAAARWSI